MSTKICSILFLLLLFAGSVAAQSRTDRITLRWLRSKPAIGKISVEGNKYFSEGEIKKRLYSHTTSFWRRLNKDRRSYVQRESLGRDTLEMKYLYVTKGFLAPTISISYEMMLPDSNAHMHITVNEGNQWFVDTVLFPDSLTSWFRPRVMKLAKNIKADEPINLVQLAQVSADIKTLYANNGYPYARITYDIDSVGRTKSCPVTFRVTPDSLVYIGNIAVDGTKKYPEKVVRRELAIKTGDIYRRNKILESQSHLFASGYFSSANIAESDASTNRIRPDFLVRVTERKTRYVNLRTGAGQSETKDLLWDFSGNFGQRNFLGSRRLDIGALYSFSFGAHSRLITHRYQFQYTEPWLAHIRMPLVLTLQYNPPLRSVLQDYKIESWKFSASTSRQLSSKVIAYAGFEYQSVNISGVPASEEEVRRQEEGLSIRRRLYASLLRDSRNNLFVPTQGTFTEYTVDYFGGFLGGDDNFAKATASWSKYQPIWPGWIWATRIKGGWGRAFGDSKDIPRDERFYLGGANTIRGFTENSLGPLREDGSADGANYILLFNQEFRWKTIQILTYIPGLGRLFAELPLWQTLFVDAGNGFAHTNEIAISNFAVSYGTGFQLISPAGPIRVDYGRHIRTERYSAGDRWHFTILYAF